MKRTMLGKKRVAVAMIVVMLCSVVMVGSAVAEKVTLRLAIAAPDAKDNADTFEELFAPFKEAHPNIDLEITVQYGGSFDKLAMETMGGVAADIFRGFDSLPILAMRNEMLLDLQPYIDADGLSGMLQDFVPATIEAMRQDGGLYGLPYYSATGCIYYNTQLFSEAGLESPTGDWDWDAFAKTAKKLTESDGIVVSRVGLQQLPGWIFVFPWLAQAGVEFNDPMQVPLDHPGSYEAIEYIADSVNHGTFGWGWSSEFWNRNAAMTYTGSWELVGSMFENALSLGFAEVPTGKTGKATFTNTDIMAISGNTKHPKEAWEFLKWYYSEDVQMQLLEKVGLQPARLSLGYEWINIMKDLYIESGLSVPTGLNTFLDSSLYAMPQPYFMDATVISQYIMPVINDVVQGTKALSALSTASVAAENYLLLVNN